MYEEVIYMSFTLLRAAQLQGLYVPYIIGKHSLIFTKFTVCLHKLYRNSRKEVFNLDDCINCFN